MSAWSQRGKEVGRLLSHAGIVDALAPFWLRWARTLPSKAGALLRRGVGVPLSARRAGEAESALFPLPLPVAEKGPPRGRARLRWRRRSALHAWLCLLVAEVNVMYGFSEASYFEPSAAQRRCLDLLNKEIGLFLREARKVDLGGEEELKTFVGAHLSDYDSCAHVLPLDVRAGVPSLAATCNPQLVVPAGTAVSNLLRDPGPYMLKGCRAASCAEETIYQGRQFLQGLGRQACEVQIAEVARQILRPQSQRQSVDLRSVCSK